jgi:ribosomal protein S18 acetylase RimI-like enzyme
VAALIRHRSDADLPSCIDAMRAAHDADGYPTVWPTDPARWLTSRHADVAAWVADVEGTIVGHVALVQVDSDTPTSAVVRLFVHPAARGTGIGLSLMSAATDHARTRGTRLVLEVADSGDAAIRLYERLGWRRVGERRADWSEQGGRRPTLYDYVLDVR